SSRPSIAWPRPPSVLGRTRHHRTSPVRIRLAHSPATHHHERRGPALLPAPFPGSTAKIPFDPASRLTPDAAARRSAVHLSCRGQLRRRTDDPGAILASLER